jgi:hypothetical protein
VLLASILITLSATAESDGIDVIRAATDLSPVLSELNVERDGEPIELVDARLRLAFEDPRDRGEIVQILLDPDYRPTTPGFDDFFTGVGVRSPVTSALATETGLCNWDAGKTVATCVIEDDGGRFQIVVKKRGASLEESEFLFRIAHLDGYDGFRAGADEPADGEDEELHAININLKGSGPVDTPIVF